jgi:hypothetical protein
LNRLHIIYFNQPSASHAAVVELNENACRGHHTQDITKNVEGLCTCGCGEGG